VHKGAVRKIGLPSTPNGKVLVRLELEKETESVVKKDSVVSIKSSGLLGDQFVEVSFGTEESGAIRDGDTLTSREPSDMAVVVSKMEGVLDRATGALANMEEITAKVNGGRGTLGSLLNDKSFFNEAKAGVTALKEDAEALKSSFFLRGFFKNRGYKDASDLTANEIKRIPAQPPGERLTFASQDLFDKPDNAKLKNEKRLEKAGRTLETSEFREVIISATTGAKGDSDESRDLARARAYVVRKHLVDKYSVDDRRIKTIGLGKSPQGSDEVRILIFR
jgi:outer membrane protein OmpA-like peptidoglycan-associated protein